MIHSHPSILRPRRSPARHHLAAFLALASVFAPHVALANATLAHTAPTPTDFLSRVPDNAIAYLTWGGTETPEFKKSKFQQLIASSGFQAVLTVHLPALLSSLSEDPDAADGVAKFLSVVKTFASRPLSLYVLPPKDGGMVRSEPTLVAVIEGGDTADALQVELSKQLAELGGTPPDITLIREGSQFFLLGGTKTLPPVAPSPLSATPTYIAAMKDVAGPTHLSAFIHLAPIIKLATSANPEAATVVDTAGFSKLESLALTAGFDERGEWLTRSFLSVPGPHTGILGVVLNPRTAPDPLLKRVPADAVYFAQYRLDIPKLFDAGVDVAAAINPALRDQAPAVWNYLAAATGVQLRTQLLEALSPDMLMFEPASAPGKLVALNAAKDAKLAHQSIDNLVAAGQRFLLMAGKDNPEIPKLERSFTTVGATKITTVALKLPDGGELPDEMKALAETKLSYAFQDGLLLLANDPAALESALTPPSADITTAPAYTALMTKLNIPDTASRSFVDLPRTAASMRKVADSYAAVIQTVLPDLDFKAVLADVFDPAVPLLTPAAEARWSDSAGYHFRSSAPFPGGELWSTHGGTTIGILAIPVMVSILVPSLARARETATRVRDASSLRQIGMASMMHADDHDNKFPADLSELFLAQDLPLETFIVSRSGKTIPDDILAAGKQEQAVWIAGNSDIIYLGKDLSTARNNLEDIVLAHEKIDIGAKDGINVLFADGRVEFIPIEALEDVLQKDKDARAK